MVSKINYRINQSIKTKEVRVIDEAGKQLGIMETAKALALAEEKGLDLVEVAPTVQPPVAKLLDFKRFVLERRKQDKAAQRDVKSEHKEIRIGPNIGEADLEIRAKRVKEFLGKGYQVRVAVMYRGREITHPEVGLEKINKLLAMLVDEAKTNEPPKRKGRIFEVTLIPKKQKEG